MFGSGAFPLVVGPAGQNEPCVGNVNTDAPVAQVAISPQRNTVPNVDGVPGEYPTVTSTVLAETGTTTYTDPTLAVTDPKHSTTPVTCDSNDPCTFAVAVYTSAASNPGPGNATMTDTHVLGVPVTFLPDSLSASCGGAAPGEFQTAGSDRLSSAITAWTLGACGAAAGGGKELTTNTSSQQSDASALCSFASGKSALAYSGVGYDATKATGYGATSTFEPANCSGASGPAPDRPYVAVPIGINAVVFAHTQTQQVFTVANQTFVEPYSDQFKITIGQAATLLSNGSNLSGSNAGVWNSVFGQALIAENPGLTNDIDYFGGSSSVLGAPIEATSGTDATTLFATGFFRALAPSDMTSNPNGPGQTRGGTSQPLGVSSNFGLADPALYNVHTFTGSQAMNKDLTPPNSSWLLTNAASAAATWGGQSVFALQTPDSIGSATPAYVVANKQTMDAAVSEMTAQPDGTLMPNPNTTPVNGVEPYPLTYVEYAIAPTQPLLNPDCSPNTQAQQALAAWLNYVTGVGQSEMPAGLQSLTPALQGQAAAAIAKVGQAAPACTPTAPTAPATTTPATTSNNAGAGSGFGAGSLGPSSGLALPSLNADSVLGGSPAGSPVSTTNGSAPGKGSKQPALELTRFTAHPSASWIGPLVGLLALAILLPAFVLAVSGASLSEALAGLGGWTWIRRRVGRRPPGTG